MRSCSARLAFQSALLNLLLLLLWHSHSRRLCAFESNLNLIVERRRRGTNTDRPRYQMAKPAAPKIGYNKISPLHSTEAHVTLRLVLLESNMYSTIRGTATPGWLCAFGK